MNLDDAIAEAKKELSATEQKLYSLEDMAYLRYIHINGTVVLFGKSGADLMRLLEEGWLKDNGDNRRPYRVTDKGKEELLKWENFT